MKIHLETADQHLISHYGAGSISVDGTAYSSNILISSQSVIEHWFDGPLDTLDKSHFSTLLELADSEKPDIVLLGTGTQHQFPKPQTIVELHQSGLNIEVMNTRAACRTYSVLVGEHRSVAAALIQLTE